MPELTAFAARAADWAARAMAHPDPMRTLYQSINDTSLPVPERQQTRRAAEALVRIWRGEAYGPLPARSWRPIPAKRMAVRQTDA